MIRRAAIIAAAALALAGCGEKKAERAAYSEPALSKLYRDGELAIVVSLSETNITTAGEIKVMIDARAPADAAVEIPDLDEWIKPFTVTSEYAEPDQALPNGNQLRRRVWTIVPGPPGDVELKPIEIRMDGRVARTDPIMVRVASVLPPDAEGFALRDIIETIEPESDTKRSTHLIPLGAILLLAALLGLVPILTARRPKKEIVLTPHQAALAALEQLPEDQLPRVDALANILIRFIKGHFNLPASAQTLHELLPLLPKDHLLGRRYKLEEFLLESEGVRFSNVLPPDFADQFEAYTRDFIEQYEEAE